MTDYSKMPGLKNPGMQKYVVRFAGQTMGHVKGKTAKGVASRYAQISGLHRDDADLVVKPHAEAGDAHRKEADAAGEINMLKTGKVKASEKTAQSTQTGPKGGRYYTSPSGEKVYVK